MKDYRHEYKYRIDPLQKERLRSALSTLLYSDSHTDERGYYSIRSLYFDDWDNRCFHENENGTGPREKFRIRMYNADPHTLRLELKQKRSGMTRKLSCPVSLSLVTEFLSEERFRLPDDAPPILAKLYMLQETSGMHPVTIVEYDRQPFTYPEGNVRVTLDMDLRCSERVGSFLEPWLPMRPVLAAGTDLLEVKFDELLPDHIHRTLQTEDLKLTAFSKYYFCRKAGQV
ncbi:MAG: polyphosphate polymerase domain-containing protein [Clostridiales bacterium]|nr:polyphosphate polymerase domain-containing protein [Clostridiales bacterium]